MSLLGFGVPGWPHPSTSWDWWPFLGITIGLYLELRLLRLPLTWGMVAAAIAAGPVFAWTVHAWGVVPTIAAVACSGIATRTFVRRLTR